MRLGIRAKVGGTFILILVLAFGASTWISVTQLVGLMEKMGGFSGDAIHQAYVEQAGLVYASLDKGTKGSVEEGDMDLFQELLNDLGQVEGVLEVGMGDPDGKISYSSDSARVGKALDSQAFRAAADANGQQHTVESADSMMVLGSQIMTQDCLECHDAEVGDLAGVLYVRFSLDGLMTAKAKTEAFVSEARSKGTSTGMIVGLLGLAAAAIGAFVIMGIAVHRPLIRLLSQAEEMASGEADLTKRLPVTSSDEMGQVATAFNAFVENLQGLIADVLATAASVAQGSTEILAASQTMLDRSTSQNDRTRTAATSAEEMSATVLEVSKGAHEATDVAHDASQTAQRGAQIVEEEMVSMATVEGRVKTIADKVRELGQRSQEIGEVMQVIDDIADQTNLLALNAAIEAARAGEQGRGFSVVADEVRKLSEKTAQATGQVRETVAAIQNETEGAIESVNEGLEEVVKSSELATRAGEGLRDIVLKIERNSEMISQIATATEQQSVAVSDISSNLDSIADLASEIVAGAEQSGSGAERLGAETQRLQELVSRFKV